MALLPHKTLPETNIYQVKMDGWKNTFLLGWPISGAMLVSGSVVYDYVCCAVDLNLLYLGLDFWAKFLLRGHYNSEIMGHKLVGPLTWQFECLF